MGCTSSQNQDNKATSISARNRPYTSCTDKIRTRDGSFKVQYVRGKAGDSEKKRRVKRRNTNNEDEENWCGGSSKEMEELECDTILAEITMEPGGNTTDETTPSDMNMLDESLHFTIFRAFDRQEKFRRYERRREIEAKRLKAQNGIIRGMAISELDHRLSNSGSDCAPSDVNFVRNDVVIELMNDMHDMNNEISEETAHKALKRCRNNKTLAVKYINQQMMKP